MAGQSAGAGQKRVLEMRRGDPCNLTPLSMGVHSGTHMDAPVHFIPKGLGIDAMPVDAGVGRARVIAIRDPALILGRKNCAGIESVPVSELFSRLATREHAMGKVKT